MSSATFVIRPAQDTDIPEVIRIEQASFADPWSAESFTTSLDLGRMRFLVAEDVANDALLGYIIALVLADEAEIADLAVATDARCRGIGGLLLDRMVELMAQQGVRWLYLEVRESNSAARALYESRSFEHVGLRRGYYRHPTEDALLLKRDLVPT